MQPKLVTERWWEDIKPGDAVTWMKQERGGWGYVTQVWATVVKVNRETVSIRCCKKDGTEVVRQVKPDNLRKREL